MSSVRVERQGPIVTVILHRPETRNAVDAPTAERLAAVFRAFDHDEEARAAVLYGEGGTFCSGADLKSIAAGKPNRIDPDGDGPMGPTRMQVSKPVIAAISGYAVGGGLELALWCDLRIAEEDAILGVFNRRFGVPLIDGGTVRLPRIIGLGRALDLILTGRPVGAQEALHMGLVSRVVPKGTSRLAAEALALQLTQMPQAGLIGDRRSTYEVQDLPPSEAFARELSIGRTALESADVARFVAGEGRHGSLTEPPVVVSCPV